MGKGTLSAFTDVLPRSRERRKDHWFRDVHSPRRHIVNPLLATRKICLSMPPNAVRGPKALSLMPDSRRQARRVVETVLGHPGEQPGA
ncbi:hypothetical protein KIF59_02550 [Enterobacter cloacae subsp. cloacae]|nr:hypothetical protein [Enterobacter cloacae subsp. cloacae]